MTVKCWALHRDNQQLLCSWIATRMCANPTILVSVGWNAGPHSQIINGYVSPFLRGPPRFQVCWYSLSSSVPWFDIISCGDTQGACMSINPVHWRIIKKVFAWKLAKLTEQCWRDWRPTSKNALRNASMKTYNPWRTSFSKLKLVKC